MEKKDIVVVYIITKLELGGAQKVCLNLFNNLNDQNIKTYLISGSSGLLVQEVQDKHNVILLDELKREVGIKNIIKEVKNCYKIYKILKSLKQKHPNLIIHTHSTKAGLIGRWAAFFARAKTRIHTVHGYAFHDHQNFIKWSFIYFCELMTSFITTHFVCVSSKDLETGCRLFPNFKRKSSIIRAAVDSRKFIPATKDTKTDFVFGTISCFKPQKNLQDLIAAFKLVKECVPNVKLEIVGDGIERPLIEQQINLLELQNDVILLGWQDNVNQFMMHWDTFVMSSLWEGLPCAIIEARLMKLPVIAYNVGGIKDIIANDINGYLIEPKNYHALKECMFKIATNKNLYQKLSDHNDQLSEFTYETMQQEHAKLYSRVINL